MSEPKPPLPESPSGKGKEKKDRRGTNPKSIANLHPIVPGEIRNPKGRPSGVMQVQDAVRDFVFRSGKITGKDGKEHEAFKILMQGWVMKAREDIEFARFLLALIVGKEAEAAGDVPGLEGGRTYIRRERLLEIFREAQGEDGMRLIDVPKIGEGGGNGNGTGSGH